MGNVDSRAKHDAGYILVQTDKPFYEPGENVTGKVFVRCLKPVDAKHIMLEITGKEKTSLEETVAKHSTDENG